MIIQHAECAEAFRLFQDAHIPGAVVDVVEIYPMFPVTRIHLKTDEAWEQTIASILDQGIKQGARILGGVAEFNAFRDGVSGL